MILWWVHNLSTDSIPNILKGVQPMSLHPYGYFLLCDPTSPWSFWWPYQVVYWSISFSWWVNHINHLLYTKKMLATNVSQTTRNSYSQVLKLYANIFFCLLLGTLCPPGKVLQPLQYYGPKTPNPKLNINLCLTVLRPLYFSSFKPLWTTASKEHL